MKQNSVEDHGMQHVWLEEWNKHGNSLWIQIPLGTTSVFAEPLDANVVQKCQICVTNENLVWLRVNKRVSASWSLLSVKSWIKLLLI